MPSPFRLLTGFGLHSGFPEFITDVVRATLPPAIPLIAWDRDILADLCRAKAEDFDLAVLMLNNIITDKGCCRAGVLLAFEAVRRFSVHGLPVITMCGLSKYPEIADLSLAAGARFHFLAPFKARVFQDAVRQCVPDRFCSSEPLPGGLTQGR